MYKLMATIFRELRLLTRDRAGLLLLFAMPAALVLVITLVQDNVLKQNGTLIRGIVLDHDGGTVAREILDRMISSDMLNIEERVMPGPADEKKILQAVSDGDYQFCIVLTEKIGTTVEDRIRNEIAAMLTPGTQVDSLPPILPEIRVYFDPTVRAGHRSVVHGALNQSLALTQMAVRMRFLGETLNQKLRGILPALPGPYAQESSYPAMPALDLKFTQSQFVQIKTQIAGRHSYDSLPTAVQQNVPAWALFGMFFIVVPLAGSLIRERRDGIFTRLMTMPVSRLTLIMGKLGAYVCVCLVQFVFILLVGKWILPLLGTAVFELSREHAAVALVALCSALAASGYGVLLGTLARTHEQATTLGPVSVVIAAALGGIMVPVFAMPRIMQSISRFSPLAWAHDAFMELLVRGGTLSSILTQLALLLAFFAATMAVSAWAMQKRQWQP